MAVYNNFEDLPVWKEAEDLAIWIYKLTKVGNWLKIGTYPKRITSEVRSQLFICVELGYSNNNESERQLERTKSFTKQIDALIWFLKRKNL